MQFEVSATPDEIFWVQRGLQSLTKREHELFQLFLKGRSYQQIVLELGISESTVTTHSSRILQKLMVRDQRQLLRIVAALNFAHARDARQEDQNHLSASKASPRTGSVANRAHPETAS